MLAMSFVTDPDHWRDRAEDMRLTASALTDEHARARMLKIAEGYEALGRQSKERIKNNEFALGLVLSPVFSGLVRVRRRSRVSSIQQHALNELDVLLHLFIHKLDSRRTSFGHSAAHTFAADGQK
jgi:hypothetical protein